jgi:hypothetical protein
MIRRDALNSPICARRPSCRCHSCMRARDSSVPRSSRLGLVRVLTLRLHKRDALELLEDVPLRLPEMLLGQGEFLSWRHPGTLAPISRTTALAIQDLIIPDFHPDLG